MHIEHMVPAEVSTTGDYHVIKMMITAACIDYTVDEASKEIVNPQTLGDGKTATTFREYWTFVRHKDAKTDMMKSISKCPNCGAQVTEGNYVTCPYCEQTMNNPVYDWVLLKIEQVD